MQNVDVVILHAEGHRLLEVIVVSVGDSGQLFMADQALKDEVFVVERVLVEASLCRD